MMCAGVEEVPDALSAGLGTVGRGERGRGRSSGEVAPQGRIRGASSSPARSGLTEPKVESVFTTEQSDRSGSRSEVPKKVVGGTNRLDRRIGAHLPQLVPSPGRIGPCEWASTNPGSAYPFPS